MLCFIPLPRLFTATMQRQFEGKAVIVTGSSNGIGETIAILFAKHGAMVTLCGRNRERLLAAAEKCRKAGGGPSSKYICVRGDITKPQVQTAIVNTTMENFHRLDVLVCNHGMISMSPTITSLTEEQFDSMMNTNLRSVVFLIQKAVPHLEATKGCIVSTSTMATSFVFPPMNIYSMTKAGLDYLTKGLALELAPKGIRVNCVNSGFVDTDLLRGAIGSEGMTQMAQIQPLNKRLSTKEEQAEMVLFLASKESEFVTGQCVKVDGGLTLRTIMSS